MNGLYLEKLILNNFAVFEDQDIIFNNNFNAIIGETGSGKSLILDALQIILGARADKKIIRKNHDFASIEVSFKTNDPEIKEYFAQQGYPFEDDIILKRIIFSNGKSKAYANFQQCNINFLSIFAKRYIDLVGQFENQKLLSEKYQLKLIDSYASLTPKVHDYEVIYQEMRSHLSLNESLKTKLTQSAQRADYLQFQIETIEKLAPSVEDEQTLIASKNKVVSKQSLNETREQILAIIEGSDDSNGMTYNLKKLLRLIEQNECFAFVDSANLYATLESLNDISFQLSREEDLEDINYEEIMERLDLYQRLKRKFGVDTEQLVEQLDQFKSEILEIQLLENKISETNKLITHAESRAKKLAKEIHKQRVNAALLLEKELTTSIRGLRMQGASIQIICEETEQLTESGMTYISLMAETNPGEGYYKIKEIASGGELSRILLAFRQVLSSKDSISVFLFDEIDTGIGGETALYIGKALQQVANRSQVIAITHLPQIANFAKRLIVVDKIVNEQAKKTVSKILQVEGKELKSQVKLMAPLH